MAQQFKLNECIADVKRATELDKKEVMAYETMAKAQIRLGQYDQAVASCQAGNARTPWCDLYCQMAEAHMHLKKYQLALSECDQASKLDPNNITPRRTRSLVQQAMGTK
jgi:tetratricopeptide (TPR) repeat protein